MGRSRSLFPLLVVSALVPARSVAAWGFEMTPAGARANGRAGADYAGGDSASSLFYNPAGLAAVGASASVYGSLHLHLHERCYQGDEVDESSGTPTVVTSHPEVCGATGLTMLPELAGTARLRDDLVLGFGLYVPTAGARTIRFGDPETGTFNPGTGAIPTPARYQLMDSELLQLFATVGFGYAPVPRLRVGATLGWGITTIDFSNAAYSRVDVVAGLITAYADARSALTGSDGFVPRFSFGISGEPAEDVPLTVGASYVYTGDVRTRSARLAVHGLSTRIDPPAIDALVGDLVVDAEVSGVHVRVPQTSQLSVGARYALRLDAPADGVGDRLSTERFDVEVSLGVLFAERVDRFAVDLPDDAEVVVPSPIPIIPEQRIALPDRIDLDHRWRNQVSLAIGSDVSVLPGRLALRAGVRYESSGVTHGYEQLDFVPFRNVSLHFGATVRAHDRVDLTLGLGHARYPDVRVDADEARIRRIVSGDADPNDPAEATLANAGSYRNTFTALMVEANVRLGALQPVTRSASRPAATSSPAARPTPRASSRPAPGR